MILITNIISSSLKFLSDQSFWVGISINYILFSAFIKINLNIYILEKIYLNKIYAFSAFKCILRNRKFNNKIMYMNYFFPCNSECIT